MSNIAIFYSTTDGHTIKICHYMQSLLKKYQHKVDIMPINSVNRNHVEQADKIIVGASIRYGRHKKEVNDFVGKHRELFKSKPAAFFSVSIVARKPNRKTPETNLYLKKFLAKIEWKPVLTGVFAGRLNYARYRFFDKWIIRFIMWMGKGPTNLDADIEFTDWQDVKTFVEQFQRL